MNQAVVLVAERTEQIWTPDTVLDAPTCINNNKKGKENNK